MFDQAAAAAAPPPPRQLLHRPPKIVLVLVGYPGSGKSTMARAIVELAGPGWAVINQDELGDRRACEAACWRLLQSGCSVVVDRCNHTSAQRQTWVGLAADAARAGHGPVFVAALLLATPVAECKRRAALREGHATLDPLRAGAVIDRFHREREAVTAGEGIALVLTLGPQAAVRPALLRVQAAAAQAAAQPQLPRAPSNEGGAGAGPSAHPSSNNAVPLPRARRDPLPAAPAPPPSYLDDDDSDPRPIILTDLNGTVTSHTAARRSSGRNRPRPGTHHLRRLQEHFRLGVFTSATRRTVDTAVAMLEAAAGEGPPLFDPCLILCRDHTAPAPAAHVRAGGKPWDTVKPLGRWFRRLHRVLLLDDDAFKAVPGEAGNMVLVPCWREEDPQDGVLPLLVDALLRHCAGLGPEDDLRRASAAVAAALAEAAAAALEGTHALAAA